MRGHRLALSRRGLVGAIGSLLLPRRTLALDDATPPRPISLPDDDASHEAVTEWWYYTGHLETEEGRLFGFEQVTFEGRRGVLSGRASHVAVTDGARRWFVYDQRAVLDDGAVAESGEGFDLSIGDWSMRGHDGRDSLAMVLPGYAYSLELASRKPPVLHGGDGFVRTDAGAETYYYSRTRMAVEGTLTVDGVEAAVAGEAWMDHQWGSFTSFSEGGWDWFSVQLDDDSELMAFLLRDAVGTPSPGVATYVEANGSFADLAGSEVVVAVNDTWLSPHSGAVYPMAWVLLVPSRALTLELLPVMEDQELDTRQTTGVTYWEGQVKATGTRAGKPVRGRGYVELTGYASARDGIVP